MRWCADRCIDRSNKTAESMDGSIIESDQHFLFKVLAK
jgi:hypothetical protein